MGDLGEEGNPHPGVLRNENPSSVVNVFSTGIEMIQSYGWFLLLGAIGLLYLWKKYESNWYQWQKSREESSYKKYDAGTAQSRLEAMERSRARMQEQLNAQAAEHIEKQKKKEEEKRKQKIEDWDRHLEGKGYRSKYRPNEEEDAGASNSLSKSKPKKPLRDNEYNPLMGGGGGACFRPARRGGAGGG